MNKHQIDLFIFFQFLHRCCNRKMVTVYTNTEPYQGQIGEYFVETRDIPVLGRNVAIYPIEEECPEDF